MATQLVPTTHPSGTGRGLLAGRGAEVARREGGSHRETMTASHDPGW